MAHAILARFASETWRPGSASSSRSQWSEQETAISSGRSTWLGSTATICRAAKLRSGNQWICLTAYRHRIGGGKQRGRYAAVSCSLADGRWAATQVRGAKVGPEP